MTILFGANWMLQRHHIELDVRNSIEPLHAEVQKLFLGSFYFEKESYFLPELTKIRKSYPKVKQIRFYDVESNVLFDSETPNANLKEVDTRSCVEKVGKMQICNEWGILELRVFFASQGFGVEYKIDRKKENALLLLQYLAIVFGILLLNGGYHYLYKRGYFDQLKKAAGLRGQLILTIFLINLITGLIVFVTLSELQKREQTVRIRDDALVFSRISTDKTVSDFRDYFYFYYDQKFVPSIQKMLEGNSDLLSIKIIAATNLAILFDSEKMASPSSLQSLAARYTLEPGQERMLQRGELVAEEIVHNENKELLVLNAALDEMGEPVFFIEYRFTFQRLAESIRAMQNQIMVDLIPALMIGLLIGLLFAHLLIAPIQKLVLAHHRVMDGDYRVYIDLDRPDEIGELIHSFNKMTAELRKKNELQKFMSNSTYRKVMAASTLEEENLGGQRVHASVLFCDIRDFVGHCENAEAEEITSMLNEYFSAMVEVIHSNGGEVDKFIGDALLAVFYVEPDKSETDAVLRSLYCALEMKERLSKLNAKRKAKRMRPLEIGVGISFGEVISGPIGSPDRMDFTVIGDVVNVASRIEKMSKSGHHTRIVVSDSVEERVHGLVELEALTDSEIRGKEEDVHVFELIRILDLDSLLSQAKSEKLEMRVRSIELIGYSRNESGIPILLNAIQDEHEEVRIAALFSLSRISKINDDAVVSALLDLLVREHAVKVLTATVSALGKVCDDSRLMQLESFLKHRDQRLVANAVESLGRAKSERSKDLILPLLSSLNNRVKANAAIALFSSGHTEVIEVLKPMLMHSDPLMRSSAAFAIGELTLITDQESIFSDWKNADTKVKSFLGELQEAVPMLVMLLRDKDPRVKRQAVIALGKLKDKSAVLPLIDTIDLMTDSKQLIREVVAALREIGSHKLVRQVLNRFDSVS